MHINSSIPNLIGGVSQQPELLRLPSHMRLQENGFSTPAKGLSKRPGTIHLGNCTAFAGDGFYKTIDFEGRGQFHLNIKSNGSVSITDVAGNLKSMSGLFPSVTAYLTATDPETAFKFTKQADTLFVVNTERETASKNTLATATTWQALVWVRAGNYSREYSISLPGFGDYTYTTPDGSSAAHLRLTGTDYIANQLLLQLVAANIPGVQRNGSVITFTSGGYDGMTAEDGAGGGSISVVHRSVRSIAELPSRRVGNGFTVKVEGGDATAAGDHYLRYDAVEGVYKETRNPLEVSGSPDPFTMPVAITPTVSGGFEVNHLPWASRLVGDSATDPLPSFIGKRINDLFFYQDRLGLVSGEGYDLSEVGEYYNFQRTTVIDLLDSDPVSGVVSSRKVATLRHAVPFNKRLLLFADKAQFELSSGDFLTPKTVATRQLTEFECSSRVRPEGLGSSLYFPADRGNYTAVFNFFVGGSDSLDDAVDISGHVSEYIPKNISQLAASPVNNLFVALSLDESQSLFVYQFYQDGTQRLQSAWHKWRFKADTKVLSIATVGTDLFLLVLRQTPLGPVVSSEVLPLSALPKTYRMDRAVNVLPAALTLLNTGLAGGTQVTLPYTAGAGVYTAVVTGGTATVAEGRVVPLTTTPGSNLATADGNLTGCSLRVGLGYTFRATLGRFMVREQAGTGSAGVSRGRTQISRMWVNFADSSTFSVEVSQGNLPPVVYKNTSRFLGTQTAVVGDSFVGDGRFSCPVLAQNTSATVSLVNDTPLPSSFLSIDWEGYHVTRGRHV